MAVELSRRQVLSAAGAALAWEILGRNEAAEAKAKMPETAEDAAKLYGADDWSSNSENWEMYPFNEGKTMGAHLLEDPEGNHHRVNLEGAVAEGFLDLKDGGELNFFQEGRRALAFVADGAKVPQLDLRGGTFWTGKGVSTELSWKQVLEKEALPAEQGGQPGAIVVEICKAVTMPQ